MTDSSILQAAKQAYAAGLCPIRVRADGSKRPVGEWKQYQIERPDQATMISWFVRAEALGLVCGKVSDRLMMIELEARAMPLLSKIIDRMKEAGLFETFDSWVEGYCEITPSGGMHVFVHVGGDAALPGNEKLASDSEGLTLIETRGEGGFVVVAPSNGATHPTGGSWTLAKGGFDTIEWATPEDFAAVCDTLGYFDVPGPSSTRADTAPAPPTLRLGESWFDDEKASLGSIEDVLLRHGWQPAKSSDQYGQHWIRPGKTPREGHSASLSHEGHRLWVHSTNAGLPVGRSLDVLDVILVLEVGIGDPGERDRTDFVVERRKSRRPATVPVAGPVDDEGSSAGTAPAPSLNLPDEFWQARPYLAHVRTAALSVGVNPDAMWEAVKAFYAASVHPMIVIPYNGTLDYISVMVGKSGAGKTMAKRTAVELLPAEFREHPRLALGAPGGSGEGMVEFYLDRTGGRQEIRLDGAGFYVDEGKWLLDVNSRAGNTSVQAIKQGWSGELTGSLAASVDRNRWLKPGAVRMGVLVAIQPGVATDFLRSDLTEGGFPQRLSWGWAHPDEVPDRLPDHPGTLDVPLWDLAHWGTSYDPYAKRCMSYVPELMELVQQARRDGLLGRDVHGGHDTLAVLKGAALLALMDDRTTVVMDDWGLAQLDWNQGVSVRNHLLASQKQGLEDRDVAAGYSAARRKLAELDVYLERALRSLVTKVRFSDDPVTVRDIKDHLRSFNKRHGVHHQDVITLALQRGLIAHGEGGYTTP